MAISKEIVEKEIIKRLRLDNPWWITREVPSYYMEMSPRPYLEEFYENVENLRLKRAPILMGPRRVGKTVMLYHSIARLLERGIPSKHILFVSLDTPIYGNLSLERLFEYGLQAACAGSEVTDATSFEGYYVFFDEIQYLKDWERHLKSLVDTYHGVKFIASGSAAAALKMKSTESGAGRFTDFMLPPLTFAEFLELQGLDNIIQRRTGLAWGEYDTENIGRLNQYFVEYINYGGYPEVVFSPDVRNRADKYVKNDIVEKVLMRDLPSLYGINDTQELNRFFAHIAFRSGNEFSYQSLSTDSGIRKDTIKKYLDYLEAAFLIKVLKRIDQNAKRLERMTTFKIYLTNPILRSALFSPIDENDDSFGEIVETAVVSQWLQSTEADFYYANWHRGRDKGEVDIVWTNKATQKACFATEVKWTDRFAESPDKLKSLSGFLQANKDLEKALVTTKTLWGVHNIEGRKVIFVPTAIYAYAVSKMLHAKREKSLYK